MDSERRQGGPGWWRAWWWLIAWNPAKLAKYIAGAIVLQTLPVAVPAAVALLFFSARQAVTTAVGLLFLAMAILILIPRGGPRPRVTAKSQPDLYGLIERVAARIGAPMPGRVLLDDARGVRGEVSGLRRDLRIGLPALSVLTRAQLEALVAHELSPLRYRHPRLVLRLRAMRPEGMFAPDADLVRREGMLAQLFDFWSMVEKDSDAAAISLGGAENAAEAMIVGGVAWVAYHTYSYDMRVPRGRHEIQDLDDGWRRYVADGDIHTVDVDYEYEASEHTTLGDPIRGLGQVRVRLADDPVELAPLPDRDQRWFARRPPPPFFLRRWVAYQFMRWYTFGTAPPQWWVDRAERDVAAMREYLEIPAEADVLQALDDSDDGKAGLRLYLECQLLRDGWRLVHPAVRTVLISPAGDRIDLSTMDRHAAAALLP